MNRDKNQSVRWYLYTLLITVAFMLVAVGIRLSMARYSEESMRAAMEKTLSSSFDKGVKIGKRIPIPGSGLSYIHSYGLEKGKDGADRVVLVGITGSSGPFAAVFTCSSTGEARFRGLVGVAESANARKYGISDRVIGKWESRIGELMRKAGEKQ